MKATMNDLNMILFEQLERVNDDELTGDALKEQIMKSKTIKEIASVLLDSAGLELKSRIFEADTGIQRSSLLLQNRTGE